MQLLELLELLLWEFSVLDPRRPERRLSHRSGQARPTLHPYQKEKNTLSSSMVRMILSMPKTGLSERSFLSQLPWVSSLSLPRLDPLSSLLQPHTSPRNLVCRRKLVSWVSLFTFLDSLLDRFSGLPCRSCMDEGCPLLSHLLVSPSSALAWLLQRTSRPYLSAGKDYQIAKDLQTVLTGTGFSEASWVPLP